MANRMWRSSILSALIGTVAVTPLEAQIDFNVKSGTTWVDKLTVSQLADMTFRWKSDLRDASGPYWQLTYTLPGRGEPSIVKSVAASSSASRLSDYSTFLVASGAIPSTAPSTFYIRLKIGTSYSSWIPVTVTGDTRAVTTIAPPPTLTIAPAPIATTSGVANPDPPLWVRLSRITALSLTNDGSPSDEVYAFVASVAIDHESPWRSIVWSTATNVYEDMNPGDYRAPMTPVWGTADGSPLVLRHPQDAVMMFILIEHDNGNVLMAKPLVYARVAETAKTLNPDQSYGTMAQVMERAFWDVVGKATGQTGTLDEGDDWISNRRLAFTQAEIDAARAGTVVTKEVTVGQSPNGVYVLRFQMGRAGTN